MAKLFEEFEALEDPRIERRKLHKLEDIIIITLFAVISGCNEWGEIELYGKTKFEFLKNFCELKNGIPSHDTFERLFERLAPKKFNECFVNWVKSLKLEAGIISIDGKTVRGSGKGKSAIHMISAWSKANQICLGQEKTDEKSNEITAIPKLLEALDLKGCIITIDAMGTQKEIAEQIIKGGGDYILSLKKNHKHLYEMVSERFYQMENQGKVEGKAYSIEKDHGRIERRECYVLPMAHSDWNGMKSVIMIESSRKIKDKEEKERRYYISSLEGESEAFLWATRSHWGIENSLHWSLDVTFKEDDSRKRKGNSGENFAILRRFVLSLLKQDTSKLSLKNKRLRAGWDDSFLVSLIQKI